MRTHYVAVSIIVSLFILQQSAIAGAFDPATTALLQEYATGVELEDLDNDGFITDLDFSIWVIDRVFAKPIPDYDCDDVIGAADGVMALAAELAGLSADFDDSDAVDGLDLGFVVANLGSIGVGASAGDLTGDDLVDSADLAAAAIKLGQPPTLEPIDVAVSLLEPLISIDQSVLPAQLPPDSPCPEPELCGNARCKARCNLGDTGVKWTYRLFMIGFCGSQFEADRCCQEATAVGCECSPGGFKLDCWVLAQGSFIACLLTLP